MQITIDIPETLAHKAEAAGVDVPTYLQRLIERDVLSESAEGTRLVRFGPGPKTPAEAGADILEMQKRYTLGGIKIKDLIEEGRRY
jgi:hypothetical protein